MDKLLLTPTEAAQDLGIGRSKVYELVQTGQLTSVHIGACRRDPADVNRIMDEHRGITIDAIRSLPQPTEEDSE